MRKLLIFPNYYNGIPELAEEVPSYPPLHITEVPTYHLGEPSLTFDMCVGGLSYSLRYSTHRILFGDRLDNLDKSHIKQLNTVFPKIKKDYIIRNQPFHLTAFNYPLTLPGAGACP
jgi:hypothetical protein